METKTVMKVDSKELSKALKAIAPVIKPNPIIPALDGVLLNGKTLTAANQMLSVSLPFESDIEPLILEYQTLNKAVNLLTGEINITPKSGAVEFKSGANKISIPVVDNPDSFPTITPEKEHELFMLTRADVEEINKLYAFTNQTANAMNFTAIYFSGSYFAASNGFVAAFYHLPEESHITDTFAFHPDLFKCLLALPAGQYSFADGNIMAFNGVDPVAVINYVLVQENVPNFAPFLALSLPYQVQATSYDLNKLINVVSLGVNQNINIAKLSLKVDNIISGETAWSEVNRDAYAEIESLSNNLDADIQLGILIKSLDNALKYLNSDTVTINIESGTRAFTVQGESANKLILLQPAKIN